MTRVVHEPVNAEHYSADAVIIWCFDNRFTKLFHSLLHHEELAHTDLVKVAGGAKGLASPENGIEREYLLIQIDASIRLHHTPMIYLMVHAGCGAYGKTFPDHEAEHAFYAEELEKAKRVVEDFLKEKGYSAKIVRYYADWEGLAEIG